MRGDFSVRFHDLCGAWRVLQISRKVLAFCMSSWGFSGTLCLDQLGV